MKKPKYRLIRALALLILLFIPDILNGTTYYISNNGNDLNDGLSILSPWQSIEKLNSEMQLIVAGDKILFKRGDIFTGTIRINANGNPDNPIILSSYGKGEKPVITGFVRITDWQYYKNNIWESRDPVSQSSNCNVVLIDGINIPMGRWPNWKDIPKRDKMNWSDSSWISGIESFPTSDSMSDDSLNSAKIDWTGAELILRPRKWLFQRNKITEHFDSTILFKRSNNYRSNIKNAEYFIQNHISTLDAQDEWYYDGITKKLFLYNKKKPTDVKISTIDTLLVNKGSNIYISDLAFTGSNLYAIYTTGQNNVTIQNCKIEYSYNAVCSHTNGDARDFKFINNSINHTNNNALIVDVSYHKFRYSNVVISGNKIFNTGLFAGMGGGYDGTHIAIQTAHIDNSIIELNHIYNVGHAGIIFHGDSVTVSKNYIDTFARILDDAGGIYTNSKSEYKIISNNIICNGIGSVQGLNSYPTPPNYGYPQAFGIYLDDGSGNNNVHVIGNTIFNIVYGAIFWARAWDCVFIGNTVYNSGRGFLNHSNYITKSDYRTIIKDNLVFDSLFEFADNSGKYSPLIVIDSNYYGSSTSRDHIFYSYYCSPNKYPRTVSLQKWQNCSGFDLNSKYFPEVDSPKNIDSIYFYYNENSVNKIIPISSPMIDARGNRFDKQIVLSPYKSIIVTKYTK